MASLSAYSGEDDRLFRRNVTGDSAVSALLVSSTRIGHVQSRFFEAETQSAASAAEAPDRQGPTDAWGTTTLPTAFAIWRRLLGGLSLAHAIPLRLKMDPVRPVDKPIQDGVGQCRIADVVVPVVDR